MTAVRVGPTVLTNVVVVSSTQLRATVPAGAATGILTVVNANGAPVSARPLTLVATPTITAFSPLIGVVGTQITVTGSGFDNLTAVRFSGVAATFTRLSANTLRATVPLSARDGYVVVESTLGSGQSATYFGVTPIITGFTPTSGPGRHPRRDKRYRPGLVRRFVRGKFDVRLD